MKRLSRKSLRKDESDPHDPDGLWVKVQIAADPSGKFQEIECLVDSGLLGSALALPKELADQLGISAAAAANMLGIDADSKKMKMGSCAAIIDGQGLADLPVLIGTPAPAIGWPIIQVLELYLKLGQIQVIRIPDDTKGLTEHVDIKGGNSTK